MKQHVRFVNGCLCGFLQEVCAEPRPRLCVIRRGSNGYGFNLHSERARPGQYIRAVDEDSPAQRAGLLPKDRIIQVPVAVDCVKRDLSRKVLFNVELQADLPGK